MSTGKALNSQRWDGTRGGPGTWNGVVPAETTRPVLLEDNIYFPPCDVRREHLAATRHRSLCARLLAAAPDMVGEESQDPLPGVGCRDQMGGAPLVVEEGVLGTRVDRQVVRDTGGRQLGLQHGGRARAYGGQSASRMGNCSNVPGAK
jgi:nucleotidyltransferase-like protein